MNCVMNYILYHDWDYELYIWNWIIMYMIYNNITLELLT